MSVVLILVVFAVVFFTVRNVMGASRRAAAQIVAPPIERFRFESRVVDEDDGDEAEDEDEDEAIAAAPGVRAFVLPPNALEFTLPPGALDALPPRMREKVAAALEARVSAAVVAAVPAAAAAGFAGLRERASAAPSTPRVEKHFRAPADTRPRADGTVPPAPALAPLAALAARGPVPALRRQPPLEPLAVTTARSHAWRS